MIYILTSLDRSIQGHHVDPAYRRHTSTFRRTVFEGRGQGHGLDTHRAEVPPGFSQGEGRQPDQLADFAWAACNATHNHKERLKGVTGRTETKQRSIQGRFDRN